MNMLAPDRRQYDPGNPLTMGTPSWADAWDENPAQAAQDLVNAQLAAQQQQQPVAAPQQPPDATVAPGDGGIATVDVTAKAPPASAPPPPPDKPHPDHPDPLWADNPAQWRQLFSSDPAESDAAWKTFLAPAPATTYAGMLPVARDEATGALRPALPSGVRQLVQGAYDLAHGPATGTVTPEATMALAAPALGKLLEMPDENILSALSGGKRVAREAEVAARAEKANLLGEVVAKTEGAAPEGAAVTPAPGAPSTPANLLDQTLAKTASGEAAAKGSADTPMLNQILADLTPEQSTVSTRIPTAAGQTVQPHEVPDLKVGIDSVTQIPKHLAANAKVFRELPGVDIPPGATDKAAAEALVQHAHDNIVSTFDAVPDDVALRNAGWYDGAHRLTKDIAENGPNADAPQATPYAHQNVAGAMAALSPQKDWFENVELGKRLIDIDLNHQNTAWSPEMTARAAAYQTGKMAEADKLAAKKSAKTGTEVAPDYSNIQKNQTIIDRLQANGGATYGSLTSPYEQALWARFRDEAHNLDRSHPEVYPDGTYGPTVMQEGDKTKINPTKWGPLDNIANAIIALHAKDLPTLSTAVGGAHKVRSFYNNIIHPNEPNGAVTADTHAIAAGLFRPLGGTHPSVAHGLGSAGSSNREMGNHGIYGLYDEAYRRAAQTIQARAGQPRPTPAGGAESGSYPVWHGDILPRQVQSVAWEAIRKLFNNKSKPMQDYAEEQWKRVGRGEIDANAARQNIITNHKGFGY